MTQITKIDQQSNNQSDHPQQTVTAHIDPVQVVAAGSNRIRSNQLLKHHAISILVDFYFTKAQPGALLGENIIASPGVEN